MPMTELIMSIPLDYLTKQVLSTGGDNRVDNSAPTPADPNVLTPVTQSIGVKRDSSLDKLCTPL
jgi:hypothetical protein